MEMKPYLLALYNKLRFLIKHLLNPSFQAEGIQLFNFNTKIVTGKNCRISFGEKIVSDGRMVMMVDENAELVIGQNTYFNEDAMISCKGRVEIGHGCKFGPNVKIFDNNHQFDLEHGVSGNHKIGTISIGEKCWFGANVVVLKDVKIGKHSVIGAGCVISQDIPEGSIVTQGRDIKITKMTQ